ncbi:MAG: Protein Smg [Calditrichaeota bacterium]|nr:Protein Smg [Calditrichota bacterium]
MTADDTFVPRKVVGLAMHLLKEIREHRIALDEIEEIGEELRGQGYSDSEINAAFDWVYDRIDGVDPSEVMYRAGASESAFRVLHPAERAVLTSEAYGQLIEMQTLSMLDLDDIERLLDRAIAIGGPIGADELRTLVHSYLFEEGSRAGSRGSAHNIISSRGTVH